MLSTRRVECVDRCDANTGQYVKCQFDVNSDSPKEIGLRLLVLCIVELVDIGKCHLNSYTIESLIEDLTCRWLSSRQKGLYEPRNTNLNFINFFDLSVIFFFLYKRHFRSSVRALLYINAEYSATKVKKNDKSPNVAKEYE